MKRCGGKVLSEKLLAKQLVADPRPVMIVDTCNFGNIVGLALAGKSKLVIDILQCLQEGFSRKLFHLVVPHQVYEEFVRPGQFVATPLQALERQIHSWNAAVQTYNRICEKPNLWSGKKQYNELEIQDVRQLLSELVEISKQFLDQAIIVKASSQAQKWARQREIDRKRPARQGKDSFGDCEICGTALSFLGTLRKMDYSEFAYFVSENKEDFAFNDMLHPDLKSEFERVSLVYCQTIPQAFGEIFRQQLIRVRGQRQV